jgi:hypothetical protein
MSLVFDTGLSRSNRELIVGAMCAAFADLRRPPNGSRYLWAVVSLPSMSRGSHDEEFLSELAKACSGRVPCIAIASGSSKAHSESEDSLAIEETIEFGLYVVSNNQRSVIDGRLFVDVNAASDDTKDPGVFAILQHITERLQGADLGLAGIAEPIKSDEFEVFTGDDATVWGQTWMVAAWQEINPNRNATQVMTSIEAQHDGTGIPDASSLDPLIDSITTLNED